MSHLETPETQAANVTLGTRASAYSQSARSNCPDCQASLVVVRVIGGRADCEYWTMRCTRCGGIHLDIIEAAPEPVEG